MSKQFCPVLTDKNWLKCKEALGEELAYKIWNENKGNPMSKDKEGKKSKLFSDLMEYYKGDEIKAIQAKSKIYLDSFKDKYGISFNEPLFSDIREDIITKPINQSVYDRTDVSNIFNSILDKTSKIFPNIKYEIINNDHPKASYGKAFIDNGVIYLNYDRMSLGDPMHEYGHVFLEIIKHYDNTLYRQLISEAKQYLDTPIGLVVKDKYSNKTDIQILENLIVHVISSSTINDLSNLVSSTDEEAKSLYNSFNGVKNDFWKKIKNFILGLFGLTDNNKEIFNNVRTMSISDMARMIKEHLTEQKPLSDITSEELSVMMGPEIEESRMNDKDLLMGIYSILKGKEQFSPELLKRLRLESLRTIIKHNKKNKGNVMILPGTFIGKEVEFEGDLYSAENTEILNSILSSKEAREENLISQIITWLQGDAKEDETPMKYMTREGYEKDVYGEAQLIKLKSAILWNKYSKYYRYSELKDIPELSFLYNEMFEGFDPLISIDRDVNGKIGISIYEITADLLESSNYNTKETNIASKLIPDKIKKFATEVSKLRLKYSELNIRKVMLQLMTNKLLENENVTINDTGIIEVHSKAIHYNKIDQFSVNNDIKQLNKVKPFMDLLLPEQQKLFLPENIRYADKDPEKEMDYYVDLLDTQLGPTDKNRYWIENYKAAGSIEGKITVAEHRIHEMMNEVKKEDDLKKINREGTNRRIEYIKELRIITDFLIQYKGIRPYLGRELNPDEDISKMQIWLNDTYGLGDETIQKLRTVYLASQSRVINEYQKEMKPLKMDGGVFDKFWEETPAEVKSKAYISNIAEGMFDKLLVTETDITGKHKFKTGFIYWTNDENEDRINGVKAKALGLSKELLDRGRTIVDIIHNQLLLDIFHQHQQKGEVNFTMEHAREILEDETNGYKKGMIPLLKRTSAANLSTKEIGKSLRRKVSKFGDIFTLHDNISDMEMEQARIATGEIKDLNKLPGIFWWQFGIERPNNILKTELGNMDRLNFFLGVVPELMADGTIKYRINDKDERGNPVENINNDLSTDLELIMNYFVMTEVRTREYEKNVLPLFNAVRILEYENENNRDMNRKNFHEYAQYYVEQAIYGTRRKLDLSIAGYNLDKTISNFMEFTNFLVLPFNPGIATLSLMANGVYAYTEGITNSIMELMKQDNVMFTTGNLLSATKNFFDPEYHSMITQMAFDWQLIASSEHEVINLQSPRYQKTKKSVLSRYWMNWMNFSTDLMARCNVMTAQMIHDGTFAAMSYDKKTGQPRYDPKKDKRFGWDGRKYSVKGQALYDWTKKRLVEEGLQSEDQELQRPYTPEETRKFVMLASKYVVGSYSNREKSFMNHFILSKLLINLRNFFITRFTNAFEKKKQMTEGGRWVITDKVDETGHYIPQWERMYTEGYINTILRQMGIIIKSGSLTKWRELEYYEKRNIIKAVTNVVIFAGMMTMYNVVFYSVKEGEKDKKDIGFIPEWRIFKGIKYAIEGMLIFPLIYDVITRPFASIDIAKNKIVEPMINLATGSNIKNYPFESQFEFFADPFEESK